MTNKIDTSFITRKRLLAIITSLLLLFTCVFTSDLHANAASGGFYVSGTSIYDANGNYYAKFSYDNCVSTFGSKDFANKLDMIHVGATDSSVTVLSVVYAKN